MVNAPQMSNNLEVSPTGLDCKAMNQHHTGRPDASPAALLEPVLKPNPEAASSHPRATGYNRSNRRDALSTVRHSNFTSRGLLIAIQIFDMRPLPHYEGLLFAGQASS